MLKFSVAASFFLFLTCGCGNDAPLSSNNDSIPRIIVNKDTVAIKDSIPQIAIALTMGGDTIAPDNASDLFFAFNKTTMNSKRKLLSPKEVRKRFIPIDPNCDGEAMWQLERFFFLDSLKKINESVDHDMGQTIAVNIRVVDTIKKTPEGCWVAWTMYYTTAQQCPFAEGTYYMLSTYSKDGKLISTQCMGGEASGGDAPISWSTTQATNIFQDGSYRSLYADSTEDYDEEKGKPILGVLRRTYTGQITASGKITSEEKEIERTE